MAELSLVMFGLTAYGQTVDIWNIEFRYKQFSCVCPETRDILFGESGQLRYDLTVVVVAPFYPY
jgi:hypothetical protein